MGRRDRPTQGSPEQIAVDVLAGRVRPEARALLDLIHRVNPTGAGLPRAVEARRYELKGRLQGLLIQRFADDVVAHPEPGRPGVVSLRLRYMEGDACHAVVDQLEADARAWVQRQLDLGAHTEAREEEQAPAAVRAAASRVPSSAAGNGSALQRAIAAREAYDYDAAWRGYEAALAIPGEAEEAGAQLVALLVDLLGADGDALALEPRLPPATRARRDVQGHLALAAARTGDAARAQRDLRRLEPAPARAVLIAVGSAALAAGRWEEAERLAGEALALGALPGELEALAAGVAQARAQARRPLEAELARAHADGDPGAGALATALLQRFEESAVARRVLRELGEAAREAQARAALAQASDALAAGRLADADAHVQRARALGAEDLSLERALAAARRVAAAGAVERATRELLAALSVLGRREGLLRYATEPEAIRAAARAARDLPALAWLDVLLREGIAPARAIDGVLALESALGEAARGAHDAALSALAPHAAVLAPLQQAREALAAAQQAVEAEHRRAAEREIFAAVGARAREDREGVAAALARCDARALPPELRRERERVADWLHREARVRESEARIDGLLQRREGWTALHELEVLLGGAPEGAVARLQARHAELADALDRGCHREVIDADEAATPERDARELHTAIRRARVPMWHMFPGGRVLVVRVLLRSLIVREVDPATYRIRRRVLLRLPFTMLSYCPVPEAGELWCAGPGRRVLAVSTMSWRVLWCRELPKSAALEGDVTCAQVAPGGQHFWVICGGDPAHFAVLDVARWRVERELHGLSRDGVVRTGDARGLVAADAEGGHARYHDARGTPGHRVVLPKGWSVRTATAHPSGSGVALFVERPRPQIGKELGLIGVDREGGGPEPTVLERGPWFEDLEAATARDEGMVVAWVLRPNEPPVVSAWRPEPGARPGDEWGRCWRIAVPDDAVMMESHDDRDVHMAAPTLRDGAPGVEVVRLGAGAPPDATHWRTLDARVPETAGPLVCPTIGRRHKLVRGEIKRSEEGLSPGAVAKQRRALRAASRDDPERLLALAYLAAEGTDPDELRAVTELTREHAARDGRFRVLDAAVAARNGEWHEVDTLLGDPRGLPRLDEDHRAHGFHLQVLAGLWLNDAGRARRWLDLAEREPTGRCEIKLLRPLVEFPSRVPRPDVDPGASLLQRVLACVRHVDDALERKQPGEALQAGWHDTVTLAMEIQSLARLSAVHLACTPRTPLERFYATEVLSLFCHWMQPGVRNSPRDLPLVNARWSEAQLLALRDRAAAWLEGR